MREPVAEKVERIVRDFGFPEVRVRCDHAGQIELSGTVPDINDRALVVAIARTTPGVREVRSEVSVSKQ